MAVSSDYFDLAFAVDVIHHISDRPQAFKECRRVLRGRGRLCLVTDTPEIIRSREPLSTYFPETVEAEMARYPSLLTLGAELRAAGFTGIAEVEVEFRQELTDIEPYRAKVFSSLRLIFGRPRSSAGCNLWSATLVSGPISSVSPVRDALGK